MKRKEKKFSDFPLERNAVAGGTDLGENNIRYLPPVVKINRVPVFQVGGQKLVFVKKKVKQKGSKKVSTLSTYKQ